MIASSRSFDNSPGTMVIGIGRVPEFFDICVTSGPGPLVSVPAPCHRVLGAAGLGGFSAPGGVETKVALLKHEGSASLLI